MVTRKPLPDDTPSADPNAPPHVSIQTIRQELWSATDSENSPDRVWADGDAQQASQTGPNPNPTPASSQDVPDPLRPGRMPRSPFDQTQDNPWEDVGKGNDVAAATEPKSKLEHVPTVLRPGGRTETNPFKRKPVSGENSGSNVVNTPNISNSPVNEPQAPPTESFSQLDLGPPEPSNNNPWKLGADDRKADLIPVTDQDAGRNVWDSEAPSRQANSPALLSLPSDGESPAWDESEPPKSSIPPMPERSSEELEFSQDAHAWDDVGVRDKGKAVAVAGQSDQAEGWNLIDHESAPEPTPGKLSKADTWENFVDAEDKPTKGKELAKDTTSEGQAPALPPRKSNNGAPPFPPRPQSPSAANKTGTYQIKNISWFDDSAPSNPRRSPILVQNANGPCPLVALVNALTLTAPAGTMNTVLVETLKSREQISLNLLLEAVVDELMTRRTSKDLPLPDLTELYAFLKGLHTGMNVNPRFLPTPEIFASYKRTSLTHVHPTERGDLVPGTFEDTRDLKLYSTFSIPLIHGWLPPKDAPVYDAFSRQASSYDDVQTLLFREQELEDRLTTSEGLSEQEQQLYQDIVTIKDFLTSFGSQLTPWGIEVITKATQPGSFSILFRNDHFSLLYRHPQTMDLLTLVTDFGYYKYDEVVWQSLLDVNDVKTEFFSGDFRLVGGPDQEPPAENNKLPGLWYDETGESSNANNGGGEWQTVQGRRKKPDTIDVPDPLSPLSPNHEQEDHDLALALQLQEEEEERHRADQEARRKESQLSEQFIEEQGRGSTARTGPATRGRGTSSNNSSVLGRRGRGGSSSSLVPTRGSSAAVPVTIGTNGSRGGRVGQQVRPLVPPAATTHRPGNADEEDAPPSYEQASKMSPYHPPEGHPSHPASSPGTATAGNRRRTGFGIGANPARQNSRVQPVPQGSTSSGSGRDRDCVIM